jgi:hypothetical protein
MLHALAPDGWIPIHHHHILMAFHALAAWEVGTGTGGNWVLCCLHYW